MIDRIYEALTGLPWTTGRSMAAEYGPPPARRFPQLRRYSDAELHAFGAVLVAELAAAEAQGRAPVLPLPQSCQGLTRGDVRRAA